MLYRFRVVISLEFIIEFIINHRELADVYLSLNFKKFRLKRKNYLKFEIKVNIFTLYSQHWPPKYINQTIRKNENHEKPIGIKIN